MRGNILVSLFIFLVTPFASASGVREPESQPEAQFKAQVKAEVSNFKEVIANRRRLAVEDSLISSKLSLQRKKDLEKQEAYRADYAKTSSRYSMEKVEALERKDEEQKQRLNVKSDNDRLAFAERRRKEAEIREKFGFIDGNLEFDIDFATEPESKVSGITPESSSSSINDRE